MLTAFSIKTQYLHRCSQRKRRERKNEEIAASEGGLSRNVGQTYLGKILAEEGRQEEAFKYFEAAAKQDLWAKTSLGLLYCYRFDEWNLGMEHLNEAAEHGYEPAVEAVNAIRRH